ncbi:MAG: hypothetical protein E7477_01565 [Ruminococcaceae bacterium]|nr:hypothetical protein [Oscillospiraceae bacterium]
MDKQKKKNKGLKQIIPTLFFLGIGMFCGFFIGTVIGQNFDEERPIGQTLLIAGGLFLSMYAAIVVQLIIHEAGHLVFGLMSGYKFSSFRIFSFMWVKESGRIRLKRLSIAGTGGQCLMSPPDMIDGKIPVTLYNLGGSLMNVIASTVFLILFILFKNVFFVSTVLLFFTAIGYIIAIMNGVPMRMGTIDNDGYNAFSLTKSPEAMRAFWVQMKANEQISNGVRLKDMPDEWFKLPSDEAMKNSMVATLGVFICNRLMDKENFEEADKLMEHMLSIESGMVGLHRNLLVCDRMFIEMTGENRKEIVDLMLTKEQKTFMKQMKNFPSVLRTEYVYALLCENDTAKAEKIRKQFENIAKTYPYPNDIQAERELMEIAEKIR